MRVIISLACGECKRRNYSTMKNKKNDPDPSILKYWQPEIGIKEGITKIIEEMQ